MHERITITDTGTGSWYGPKKFELRSIELEFSDRGGTATTLHRFDVVWHKIVSGRRATTSKRFTTFEERADWQGSNLAKISFSALDPEVTIERRSPFEGLAGHRLAAVVFDDPTLELVLAPAGKASKAHRFALTCNALVAVLTSDGVVTPDDPGYADSLVSLRGAEVTCADEYLDTGLTLEMNDGAAISITPHLARSAHIVASYPGDEGPVSWTVDSAVFTRLVGHP